MATKFVCAWWRIYLGPMKVLFTLLLCILSLNWLIAQLPNPDFEKWDTINSLEVPKGWEVSTVLTMPLTVQKTTDAFSGNYALDLQCGPFFEGCLPGFAEVHFIPTSIPTFFSFYVKSDTIFAPGKGLVTIFGYHAGVPDTIAYWETKQEIETYQRVILPIDLVVLPDSIKVRFEAFTLLTPTFVAGISALKIDQIEMDGATAVEPPAERHWNLYPNPSQDFLFIESKGNEPFDYQLRSMHGQLIMAAEQQQNTIKLDVRPLPGGTYILEIRNQRQKMVKRMVKIE